MRILHFDYYYWLKLTKIEYGGKIIVIFSGIFLFSLSIFIILWWISYLIFLAKIQYWPWCKFLLAEVILYILCHKESFLLLFPPMSYSISNEIDLEHFFRRSGCNNKGNLFCCQLNWCYMLVLVSMWKLYRIILHTKNY